MVTNTFNDDIITYDEIGSPLTIGNSVLTWINGRQLCSYSDQLNTINYNYNESGIRNKKVVNNVIAEYSLSGSEIVFANRAGNMLYYLRNAVDGLVGFMYNNTKYYYIKNKQNDIIGIMDDSFNTIAKYEYDSWGNIISVVDSNDNDVSSNYNHIANINPFRYRCYYYDKETNLYYLNDRYYNPLWGRFINVDNTINSNNDILSHNLYLYCSNNPISNLDNNGSSLLSIIVNTIKTVVTIYKTVKSIVKKVKSTSTKTSSKKNTNTNNNSSTTSNLPDYTNALNKALVKNSGQAGIMKNAVSPVSVVSYTYKQFIEEGEWNFRTKENWERDIDAPYLGSDGKFLYNGQVTTAEDFGNIHYGFVGTYMGYDPIMLFIGGGYAKCGISQKIFEPPYYCDDENDHINIQRGIDMYNGK